MSNTTLNPNEKTAFVSGANRGIGKAITIELLENGAKKVYAGARNIETLNELNAKYGDRLIPVQLDVTDSASINNATSQIEDLDLLVNNAGVFSVGQIFSDAAQPSLTENLNVNVWGLINLSNALVKHLKKDEATAIVNISSVAGLGNMPMASTYSVSKAAVHSITQGMRAELSDSNTLVTGVYPGPIDTDMTAEVEMEKDSPENVAKSIINGLISGTEDVYPDVMSQQIGESYATNPKAIEQQFAQFK